MMHLFKSLFTFLPAVIIMDVVSAPSCNQPTENKNKKQEDIGYNITIDNLNSSLNCRLETTSKGNKKSSQFASPAGFKIDEKEMSYIDSRDEIYYAAGFESAEFKNGMHTLKFTDAVNTSITDSFYYCQPQLEEAGLMWINDRTLKVKVDGGRNGTALGCYIEKEGSNGNIETIKLIIDNGYMTVSLLPLLAKRNYTEPGNYILYANYYYNAPLKSGKGNITLFGNCVKPLKLKLK